LGNLSGLERLFLFGNTLNGVIPYELGNLSQTNCNNADIPKKECNALVALYDSTDGPNWTDSDGWNDSDQCH
jgi:hypothetical protein